MSAELGESHRLILRAWMDNTKKVAELGHYLAEDADVDTALLHGYRVAAILIDKGTACPSGLRLNGMEYSMRELDRKFGPWKDQL